MQPVARAPKVAACGLKRGTSTPRSPDPSGYSPGAALLTRAQRLADLFVAEPTLENRYRLEAWVTTIEDVRGTYAI